MILLDKELIAINEYEQVSAEAVKKGLKKKMVYGHLKNSSHLDG